MPHRPLAALALLLGMLAAAGPARAAEPDRLPALRQQALELVNRSRREAGLDALRLADPLDRAAQAHAADMLRRGYFAHEAPGGATVRDRVLEAGGSRSALVAENIARCTGCAADAERLRAFHEGWMASPGHRANILRRGLETLGFGLAVDPDRQEVTAVQNFAGPGTPPGRGADAAPVGGAASRTAREAVNAARVEAGVPKLADSQALDRTAETLLARDGGTDLRAALPEGAAGPWRSLAVLQASCAGCGAAPTEADIRRFLDQWQNQAEYRQRLLAPEATHLGFAIRADGEGAKQALVVLGAAR